MENLFNIIIVIFVVVSFIQSILKQKNKQPENTNNVPANDKSKQDELDNFFGNKIEPVIISKSDDYSLSGNNDSKASSLVKRGYKSLSDSIQSKEYNATKNAYTTTDKQINPYSGMLSDSDSLKKAFILSEFLKTPVSRRKYHVPVRNK